MSTPNPPMLHFHFTKDEVRDLLSTIRNQIETSKRVRLRNQEYVDKSNNLTNCEQQKKLVEYLDGKIARLESVLEKLDKGE